MENMEKYLDFVKKHIHKKGKVVLGCFLYNNNGDEVEKMFYVSHEMPASTVLGDIELWKLDIYNNLIYEDDRITGYIKLEG